jgi:hyperosmotically inducible protein
MIKTSFNAVRVLMLICLVTFVSGCATPYKAAVDERNMKTIYADEKITFQVKQAFLDDDQIKYMDYDVASYEGDVFLIGEYTSQAQADKAVNVARSVEGVRSVTSYLLPKKELADCGTAEELELMATIKQKLIQDEDIWSTNVDIYMVQCRAVVLGIVGSEKERSDALAHIRSVKGLKGVKSYLRVKR